MPTLVSVRSWLLGALRTNRRPAWAALAGAVICAGPLGCAGVRPTRHTLPAPAPVASAVGAAWLASADWTALDARAWSQECDVPLSVEVQWPDQATLPRASWMTLADEACEDERRRGFEAWLRDAGPAMDAVRSVSTEMAGFEADQKAALSRVLADAVGAYCARSVLRVQGGDPRWRADVVELLHLLRVVEEVERGTVQGVKWAAALLDVGLRCVAWHDVDDALASRLMAFHAELPEMADVLWSTTGWRWGLPEELASEWRERLRQTLVREQVPWSQSWVVVRDRRDEVRLQRPQAAQVWNDWYVELPRLLMLTDNADRSVAAIAASRGQVAYSRLTGREMSADETTAEPELRTLWIASMRFWPDVEKLWLGQ